MIDSMVSSCRQETDRADCDLLEVDSQFAIRKLGDGQSLASIAFIGKTSSFNSAR